MIKTKIIEIPGKGEPRLIAGVPPVIKSVRIFSVRH